MVLYGAEYLLGREPAIKPDMTEQPQGLKDPQETLAMPRNRCRLYMPHTQLHVRESESMIAHGPHSKPRQAAFLLPRASDRERPA